MKRKTYFVATRLDEAQYRKLEFLCKKTGFSQYKILRRLLDEAELKERPSADYRDLCRRMDRIGNNINQIAKRINETRSIYQTDINEIKKEMEKLWRLQKSMLSRQPYLEQ